MGFWKVLELIASIVGFLAVASFFWVSIAVLLAKWIQFLVKKIL
jgi:hypothetical protein